MSIIIVTLKQRLLVWKFAFEMLSFYLTGIFFTRSTSLNFMLYMYSLNSELRCGANFLPSAYFLFLILASKRVVLLEPNWNTRPNRKFVRGWAGSEDHKWCTIEVPCYFYPRSQGPFPWSTVTLARIGHVKAYQPLPVDGWMHFNGYFKVR
jgi:hypothetical protein